MATKKAQPKKTANPAAKNMAQAALEKKEERLHKDLDHDGEKGEPKAHREKVLGFPKKLHPSGSKAKVMGKK